MISFVDHIEGNEDLLIYVVNNPGCLPEKDFFRNDSETESAKDKLDFLTGEISHKKWVINLSTLSANSVDQNSKLRKTASKIANQISEETQLRIVFNCDDQYKRPFLEGFVLAQYSFNYLKSDAKNHERALKIEGVHDDLLSEIILKRKYIFWARDLVNYPLSHLNAEQLCHKIAAEAESLGCSVQEYEKKQLESLKMGGILAVNKGSEDPPAMVVAEWKPDDAVNEKPLVFVGKGIVYDTGGLSLKPTANSMDMMKSDMAGSAGVSGAFLLLAAMKTPVYIKLIVPATDNRPGKNAYVPGDVITHFNGTTVEVMNTDAEGRLILADGISLAEKYNPELIVTMATLTGASLRATGHHAASVMGNDEKSIIELNKVSMSSGERLIEAPFWDEYKEELKSDIADMKNIGGPYAGHITAGKFLEHFATSPYVHLDIASTGYLPKKKDYMPKGGTGFGVRLLYEFVHEKYLSDNL